MRTMNEFEKLGVFYLGKTKDGLLLYDSKDLVTHAVCVGMTGSGKTGLCITLLEEAAIDGVPAIIIDPKGDLCNLLLTFPNLSPQEFQPWVEEGADATQQANLWKEGLAKWGQDGERIKRLRDAADISIYTPGSNAGLPVSILKTFAAPPQAIREDNESLSERINTTVTSLLGLIGIEADPIRSREHILLSNILNQEWTNGRDLDIAGLIQKIQAPPITKIGVMDLDSFFPADDRFQLAMALNNLLASPSFASWMEGESLDIQKFLYTPAGKPRLAIFSIAHLADAERMFFVSLLLNQVLGWMRTQSGTTSLRAILYMDEIFGYFPPVANPPSKLPLLTLLKQGRAFGLGVVLATQNPVDLDYKGLANTGTWFIGRLQTERDKARVLEGLEGIAAGTGMKFDKQAMEQTLAGLLKRIFLLNNVHDDGPEIFETRWAMSYLRGPLTRAQIKSLMDPLKGTAATPAPVASTAANVSSTAAQNQKPVMDPEITQYYIPVRSSGGSNATLTYHPMLLGAAEVRYSSSKSVDVTQQLTLLAAVNDGPVELDWSHAASIDLPVEDLESESEGETHSRKCRRRRRKQKVTRRGARILRVGFIGTKVSIYSKVRALISHQILARQKASSEFACSKLRERNAMRPWKSCAASTRRSLSNWKKESAARNRAVEREREQAKGQKLQTAISVGATLLSSFLGRKRASMSTLGRATTAVRGAGRSMKEAQDVDRAEDNVEAVEQKIADLDAEFKDETASLERSFDSQTEQLETVSLKPTKANISVKLLTLAWAPYWHDSQGQTKPAWE